MPTPLITIVVPTRNRTELAVRAVRSVLAGTDARVEALVLENSDTPVLTRGDFSGDERVTVLPADRPLSMHDNWERGLDAARGEYIGYISDKDMFLAGALDRLMAILRDERPVVLNYRKPVYCAERRLLFSLPCRGGTMAVPTAPLLDAWFDQSQHLHYAPMIYNSLFRTDRVRAIRERAGRFFVGNSPDVCSGVLMAADTDHYTLVDEVLCLSHTGRWSNGYSSQSRGAVEGAFADFLRLYGRERFDALGLPICITSAIAETLLACRDRHPGALGQRRINWQRLVIGILEELDALRCTPAERRAALATLHSPASVVPPRAVRWGAIEQWLTHYDSKRPPLSQVFHRGLSFATRSLVPRQRHIGPWNPATDATPEPVPTLDEALRCAAA
jgi:glycosyltransferase involved in cell wall biosynthesis